MSEQREVPEYAKPALYVGTMILSLVGAILVFVDDFGWWYEGGWINWYGYGIGTEFTPGFHKFLIVILGIAFIYVLLVALQQLYPILKVSKEVDKKLGKSGLFTALGIVVLTLLLTILFFVWTGSIENHWASYLSTGFYAGLFGGLLSTLFFWLAGRIDKQKS